MAPCAARARCFRRLACSSFHSLVDTNPANLVPSFSTTCLGTGSGYSCRSTGTGVAPIGGGSNTRGSAATAGGSRPARRGDIAAARLPKGADRCGATKTTRSRLSTMTDGAFARRRRTKRWMSWMKRKRAKKTSQRRYSPFAFARTSSVAALLYVTTVPALPNPAGSACHPMPGYSPAACACTARTCGPCATPSRRAPTRTRPPRGATRRRRAPSPARRSGASFRRPRSSARTGRTCRSSRTVRCARA